MLRGARGYPCSSNRCYEEQDVLGKLTTYVRLSVEIAQEVSSRTKARMIEELIAHFSGQGIVFLVYSAVGIYVGLNH